MKLESNEEYGGVSFVLTSGENWYKDNGNSDYFLGFKPKDSASKIVHFPPISLFEFPFLYFLLPPLFPFPSLHT